MIGTVLGGIFTASSKKKQDKMIAKEKEKNEQWYNRRYNEVGTERADAQAALTAMRDAMKERSKAAKGASIVSGGSEESMATEKAAQTAAMAQTISSINAANEQRKDAIESQYLAKDSALVNEQLQAERLKAAQLQQAAQWVEQQENTVIKAAAEVFGGMMGK